MKMHLATKLAAHLVCILFVLSYMLFIFQKWADPPQVEDILLQTVTMMLAAPSMVHKISYISASQMLCTGIHGHLSIY